jgi:hypothetical protein
MQATLTIASAARAAANSARVIRRCARSPMRSRSAKTAVSRLAAPHRPIQKIGQGIGKRPAGCAQVPCQVDQRRQDKSPGEQERGQPRPHFCSVTIESLAPAKETHSRSSNYAWLVRPSSNSATAAFTASTNALTWSGRAARRSSPLSKISLPCFKQDRAMCGGQTRHHPIGSDVLRRDLPGRRAVPDASQRQHDVALITGPVRRCVPQLQRVCQRPEKITFRRRLEKVLCRWAGQGSAVLPGFREEKSQDRHR